MYIHEAIAKTKSESDAIYRMAWLHDSCTLTKYVSIRTRGRMLCTNFEGSSPLDYVWKPNAEDLVADDWEVYRAAPIRYLGTWNL